MRFGKTTTAVGAGAGLIIGFIAGVGAAQSFQANQAADVTIAPCSAYAETSHPHFDGPVWDGICVADDGTLSIAEDVTR